MILKWKHLNHLGGHSTIWALWAALCLCGKSYLFSFPLLRVCFFSRQLYLILLLVPLPYHDFYLTIKIIIFSVRLHVVIVMWISQATVTSCYLSYFLWKFSLFSPYNSWNNYVCSMILYSVHISFHFLVALVLNRTSKYNNTWKLP